jgi:hypothetical protein
MKFGIKQRDNSLVGVHRAFDPDKKYSGGRCGAYEFGKVFYPDQGLNAGVLQDVSILIPRANSDALKFNLQTIGALASLPGCVSTRLIDLYLDLPRSIPDEVHWLEPIVNCHHQISELISSCVLADTESLVAVRVMQFLVMTLGGDLEEQEALNKILFER